MKSAQWLVLFLTFFFTISLVGQEKNAVYYNKEGWNYLKKRDSVKALASFKAAVAQNNNYKDALSGLGYTYLLRGGEREAYAIFKDLEKKYPKDVEVLNGMGNALSGLSHYDDALAAYQRALDIDSDNVDALYGKALVYHRMGKRVFAERTIEFVFHLNPYHYDTLILAGRIKYGQMRLDEAEHYIKKAIDVRLEYPEAYIESAKLLIIRYNQSENPAFLNDAEDELGKAMAIDPETPEPLKMLGIIKMIEGDFLAAQEYLVKANQLDSENYSISYNLAIAYEKLADLDNAEKKLTEVLELFPDDPMTIFKLEKYLVDHDYAFGNPLRNNYAKQHFKLFVSNSSKNLTDYGMMHLRLSLYLDPSGERARLRKAEYYQARDFNRLYIDELKHLQKISPTSQNREKLNVEVIKRRERLYSREGYALEVPPRSVARVFVVPFSAGAESYTYFDAGEVFSENLNFALQQFGRMDVINGIEREALLQKLGGVTNVSLAINRLSGEDIDYLITGNFDYRMQSVDASYMLADFATGAKVYEKSIYENGKDLLNRVNFRAASYIFDNIELQGKVLKVDENSALVNIGSYDGLETDNFLYAEDRFSENSRKRKIILKVTETDTYLSKVSFVNPQDYHRVSENTPVFYLERKRAQKIE